MNTVFAALYARVIWPMRDRLTSEKGLEAVEYALIAALMSVVIIAAMALFRDGLTDLFTDIKSTLMNPTLPGGAGAG